MQEYLSRASNRRAIALLKLFGGERGQFKAHLLLQSVARQKDARAVKLSQGFQSAVRQIGFGLGDPFRIARVVSVSRYVFAELCECPIDLFTYISCLKLAPQVLRKRPWRYFGLGVKATIKNVLRKSAELVLAPAGESRDLQVNIV